ncbi:S41 family peptidase [Aliikangiella sp. IMCC44359]|uniref:S41 family peptidase n=1 Tax=Aliikangiella sp. IMCC44359 TaxID=3459125 RepID=UPI00403B2467
MKVLFTQKTQLSKQTGFFQQINRLIYRTVVMIVISLLSISSNAQETANPKQKQPYLTHKAMENVITNLSKELNQRYIFPKKVSKIKQQLLKAVKQHNKPSMDAHQFSNLLTDTLMKLTTDKHLAVFYSETAIPDPNEDSQTDMQDENFHKRLNFGVEQIQRFSFNIGYLNLTMFSDSHLSSDVIAAAMTVLSNTDALIIDLRDNGGGDPETVAMLASYFLDKKQHLNNIHYRENNRTEQIWSSSFVKGEHYGSDKPLYILTSQHSFSAAEDFAYTLKHLKRATIIGETTGGGAHPGDIIKITDHYAAFIPNARTLNVVTKSNWEGAGVTPDISVPASNALAKAQIKILNNWIKSEKNPGRIDRMKKRVDSLEKKLSKDD